MTGSLGNLELSAPTAGSISIFNVAMTTIGEASAACVLDAIGEWCVEQVEGTGKIMIYFPIGFEIEFVTLERRR